MLELRINNAFDLVHLAQPRLEKVVPPRRMLLRSPGMAIVVAH